MIKKPIRSALSGVCMLLFAIFVSSNANAAQYIIDKPGMHAAINFKIKHLGFSWLTGRFNDFDGTFTYDGKNPATSKINVKIDPASIDSNHAKRDKHLRGKDFLDVEKFPSASFKSTRVEQTASGKFKVTGDLSLHGVTKSIVIDAEAIGEGKDPWGGYRAGFAGTTQLTLADFGIDFNLGPASKVVELELYIEGVRQ